MPLTDMATLRASSVRRAGWIDISTPIAAGMVHWPNDPAVDIVPTKDMARGASCNTSRLTLGSHTGTHIDAPRHFLPDGVGVDAMPLDVMVGPARVIEFRDTDVITAEALARAKPRRGERLLIKTSNSRRCWSRAEFVEDFVYLATPAAELLAERGVRLVGVDYLSVAGYKKNTTEVHRALLGAGAWILEGLNLSAARPGPCDLVCLPLRIVGGDGSPARALLKPQRSPALTRRGR